MSGLTPPERITIGMIEGTDLFSQVDHAVVAAQAANFADRFRGVPTSVLARFLLTASIGLEAAIMSSDDPEHQVVACKAYCMEMQFLAAAVTRKERGLPPLGVNGHKEKQEPDTGE